MKTAAVQISIHLQVSYLPLLIVKIKERSFYVVREEEACLDR
jgi:hypothetical protein